MEPSRDSMSTEQISAPPPKSEAGPTSRPSKGAPAYRFW